MSIADRLRVAIFTQHYTTRITNSACASYMQLLCSVVRILIDRAKTKQMTMKVEGGVDFRYLHSGSIMHF